MEPYLLVGLGNPGREYRFTRHNIGFMVVDQLCESFHVRLARMQSKALVGHAHIAELKVIFAKPQTFMNLSGQSVSGLMNYYKVPIDHLMVMHDDLDLPFGVMRLRPGGGSAGQKGLGSIIERLGSQEFPRMRLGIGRPPGQMDPADYVLTSFTSKEQELLFVVLEQAAKAATEFVTYGLEQAMNAFNGYVEE